MGKRIVIVGSNFAGFTAAIELKERLGAGHEVVVLSKNDEFVFFPSMIWVPFGLRGHDDVTFKLGPIFEKKGVAFKQSEVKHIDLENKKVTTAYGDDNYDYLVIATGPKPNYQAISGLGPDGGYTQSIMSWPHADKAREAFDAFIKNPGPVVVGAVQGASCFGAAYEFLFNMHHQLKKRGLRDNVELTFMTAEPFLGHFGLGGFGSAEKMTRHFFDKLNIRAELSASVKEIRAGEIFLESGKKLPFAYSMLVPSFLGVDAVRECTAITNDKGFVKVKDTYQTERYPEVFAAGVAVAIDPPQKTPVPCGVPKTGYLSEEMAKVVVHNVVAAIHGDSMVEIAPGAIDAKCVLDAGNTGIIMLADHTLEPREHAWLIPGPEAHWAKLAFEKYFLATRKHGCV